MPNIQTGLLLPPSSSSIQTMLANNPTSGLQTSGIDEKSLKDIIEVLNKRIQQTRNLNEFSQVLQVDNISMI